MNSSPVMETTKYVIISGSMKESVEKHIEEHLSEGWILHGSLQIHVNTNIWYFAQAMTKQTEKDTRGAWG
jgi:hypothetical protein